MDPEANYREQQYIHRLIAAGEASADDKARLRALVSALRGWVAGGGFKPSGYVGPAWKPEKPKKSEGTKRGERRYADAKRRLTKKLGRPPTVGEMAQNVAKRMKARKAR